MADCACLGRHAGHVDDVLPGDCPGERRRRKRQRRHPQQTPAALTLESVNAKAETAALAGNNAWMLTSSALVLFMTAPGLAMFYGGLVRKKNVLSVIMQCLFLMAHDDRYLGSLRLFFGVRRSRFHRTQTVYRRRRLPVHERRGPQLAGRCDCPRGADVWHAPSHIPRLTHMLFQGMFFIITPALICGAFAERMKFSAMALFLALWGTVVYIPLCHMVWGGGWLGICSRRGRHAADGRCARFRRRHRGAYQLGRLGTDLRLVIGKRVGFGEQDMRPHNLTYTALGAAMLWVGWFGFNAGSELASDNLAASAFCTTHFAAAAGGLAWAFYDWLTRGKPTVLGTASGIVAGLVCITPAAGFVNPMPALAMGAIAGIVCAFACSKIKNAFGYDDALDAFGVHGVGGTLGAILTGVFATRAAWDIGTLNGASGTKLGLLEAGFADSVLKGQIAAVAVTWVLSIVATFIILKVVDAIVGLRVTPEEEVRGLDVTQHDEEGYIFV